MAGRRANWSEKNLGPSDTSNTYHAYMGYICRVQGPLGSFGALFSMSCNSKTAGRREKRTEI